MNVRILHISTVHPRRDTRVFYRECVGLSNQGYEVYFAVADGLGNETVQGVKVIDLGREASRLKNFFAGIKKIKELVDELKPSLLHFHDPELMVVGKMIQRKGIPVVFDIHENVALQILNKPYLKKPFNRLFSGIYKLLENILIRSFYIVLAEDSYLERYGSRGIQRITALNMPDLKHFEPYINLDRNSNHLFYIGGVSMDRGLDTTINALKILNEEGVDFFMHYIGPDYANHKENIDYKMIEHKIKFYGRMDSKEGFVISKKCSIGLAVLKPIQNYIGSYPTKIFEYMAIGMPVITSNFDLYKEVVETHRCGYCIEPTSAEELATCIKQLLNDQELAKSMAANGLNAAKTHYSWSNELNKIDGLYQQAISGARL